MNSAEPPPTRRRSTARFRDPRCPSKPFVALGCRGMLYPLETRTRELKSLDGIWRLCFDPERRGVEARFFEKFPEAESFEIAVPGSINEQLTAREHYLNLDWVWYQTPFRVPASW